MNIRFISLLFLALSFGVSHADTPSENFTKKQNELHEAVKNDSPEEIKTVLISTVVESKQDESTEWLLLTALLNENISEIKQLVQKLITEGKNGNSPILWAALLEKPNAAKILLECGAKIDADIVEYALVTGNTQTAIVLVQGGVDISSIIDRCVALSIAHASTKNAALTLEFIQELINRGYNVDNVWNGNASYYRLFDGKIIDLFLQNGANPNKVKNSKAPLLRAIQHNALSAVRMLLHARADVNLEVDEVGTLQTPLFWAIRQGNLKIVTLLLDSGADINQKFSLNQEEMPPLAFAISTRKAAIVKLLLERGAQS